MSTIRSFLPQTLPAQAGLEPSRARSAQNAFFQAAMGQSAAQAAAPTQPRQPLPSAAVASVVRKATPTQPFAATLPSQEREEPRLMRPGSLLDIRI